MKKEEHQREDSGEMKAGPKSWRAKGALIGLAAAGVAVLGWLLIDPAAKGMSVELYKSPLCGCCAIYVDYLRDNGFDVRVHDLEDMAPVKRDFGIRPELHSCHTAIIGGYAVEGHVPVEAIHRLLSEKPDIRGIALPGMPDGSPGMPGPKTGRFVIYTISDGAPEVFMEL